MAVALKVCGPSGAIWATVFMANNAPRTVCGSASEFAIVPIPDPALGIAGSSKRVVRAASDPTTPVGAAAAGGVAGGVVVGFAVAVGVAVVVVGTATAEMAVACV